MRANIAQLCTDPTGDIEEKLRRRQIGSEIHDELQRTPWSLTANFAEARDGCCFLALRGAGNPFPAAADGGAFSYTKLSPRDRSQEKSVSPSPALVQAQDDLRRKKPSPTQNLNPHTDPRPQPPSRAPAFSSYAPDRFHPLQSDRYVRK
jgi:hypothetical protein